MIVDKTYCASSYLMFRYMVNQDRCFMQGMQPGIEDIDFYKAKLIGTSDTQLYKQAGNSIVVNVLEYIFRKLLYDELKEETFEEIKKVA